MLFILPIIPDDTAGKTFLVRTKDATLLHKRTLPSSLVAIQALSNIDPVYLNALLPDGFVAAPLDGDHNYRFSKIWHYDRPEALALVEQGLGRGFQFMLCSSQ